MALVAAVAIACSADPGNAPQPEFGPATWELDPTFAAPGEGATTIRVLVSERACSSGVQASGRMSEPAVEYAPDSITITIGVRPLGGTLQSCPKPPGSPSTVELAEPIGVRALLDGGHSPPAQVHPAVEPTPTAPRTSAMPADLSGTSWTATTVAGQPVGVPPPRIEFDWLGRPQGRGFDGCDEFGFSATFGAGDEVFFGDPLLNPSGCDGPGAAVNEVFLGTLQGVNRWALSDDSLTLDGAHGDIVLARDLPPRGDLGRDLADLLRDGEWRVAEADRVLNLDLLGSVDFSDTLLIAGGDCSYTSTIRFGEGGMFDFEELGWDTMGGVCPVDPRPALKVVLDAVTFGSVEADGSVVFNGPEGDVVMRR